MKNLTKPKSMKEHVYENMNVIETTMIRLCLADKLTYNIT